VSRTCATRCTPEWLDALECLAGDVLSLGPGAEVAAERFVCRRTITRPPYRAAGAAAARRSQEYPHCGAAWAATSYESGCFVEIDVVVERQLDRVVIFEAGAKQLCVPPAPNVVDLLVLDESVELRRSHLLSSKPQVNPYAQFHATEPARTYLERVVLSLQRDEAEAARWSRGKAAPASRKESLHRDGPRRAGLPYLDSAAAAGPLSSRSYRLKPES
jgi:hypothetical protein